MRKRWHAVWQNTAQLRLSQWGANKPRVEMALNFLHFSIYTNHPCAGVLLILCIENKTYMPNNFVKMIPSKPQLSIKPHIVSYGWSSDWLARVWRQAAQGFATPRADYHYLGRLTYLYTIVHMALQPTMGWRIDACIPKYMGSHDDAMMTPGAGWY